MAFLYTFVLINSPHNVHTFPSMYNFSFTFDLIIFQFLYRATHQITVHPAIADHSKNLFHRGFFPSFLSLDSLLSQDFSFFLSFQNSFLIHLTAKDTAQTQVATNHAVRNRFFPHSFSHLSLSHTSFHCSHTQSLSFQKNKNFLFDY